MPGLVVVELLDGRWLGLDTRGADRSVERELEIWALVPDQQDSQTTRSGVSWDDILGAGPLLAALRSREFNVAARNAFGGTIRHLTAWWSAEHPDLTSEQAGRRVQRAYQAAWDSPADHGHRNIRHGEAARTDDGWTVDVEDWVGDCTIDGLVTLLRPRRPMHPTT